MKVKYTGFNLYGQCSRCEQLIIERFYDYDQNDLCDLELLHTATISKLTDEIVIEGGMRDQTHQKCSVESIDSKKIIGMSGTEKRMLFLDDQGTFYRLNLEEPENIVALPDFTKVESCCKNSDKIILFSSGAKLTVALTSNGNLFNAPNLLHFEGKENCIVNICTGKEHCLLLDSKGNVYSFGMGSRGQLGYGTLDNLEEPALIEALAGIKIKEISAGGWHSCAISESGDLYVWGWNDCGQLGLSDTSASIVATPRVVDFEGDNDVNFNVVKVACGSKHTIVLSGDHNMLFGAGWNKYGQLSLPSLNENLNLFTKICDISGCVKSLKCGPWNSAVLIED